MYIHFNLKSMQKTGLNENLILESISYECIESIFYEKCRFASLCPLASGEFRGIS